MNAEVAKGDLRPLFTGGDAFGQYAVIFQVVTNDFLKANTAAVKAFLADYVTGLHWFYAPANRAKAIELTAAFTKTPAAALDSYFMTDKDYYRDRKRLHHMRRAFRRPLTRCTNWVCWRAR